MFRGQTTVSSNWGTDHGFAQQRNRGLSLKDAPALARARDNVAGALGAAGRTRRGSAHAGQADAASVVPSVGHEAGSAAYGVAESRWRKGPAMRQPMAIRSVAPVRPPCYRPRCFSARSAAPARRRAFSTYSVARSSEVTRRAPSMKQRFRDTHLQSRRARLKPAEFDRCPVSPSNPARRCDRLASALPALAPATWPASGLAALRAVQPWGTAGNGAPIRQANASTGVP